MTDSVPYHLCFETLANELRVKIIQSLMEKPLTVNELCKKTSAEQSRVSHSLKMLKTCNYVEFEVKGKERVYKLRKGIKEGMKKSKQSASDVLELADKHFAHSCSGECGKKEK